MATLYQVKLEKPGPQISVPYPVNFDGKSPKNSRERLFFLNQSPCMLTLKEIELAETHLVKANIGQRVVRTGMVLIDQADPLLTAPDSQLQDLEEKYKLPSKSDSNRWGRVVAIREAQAFE